MLNAYLEELRRELARHLPAEDVQTRLTEIDAHLRDGIEGREELGLAPEAAERETLVAFGTAREVSRALAWEGLARFRIARLRWVAGFIFLISLYLAAVSWISESRNDLPILFLFAFGFLGCLAGVAMASFRSRRAAPVPIFVSGLMASVLIWGVMGTFILNIWAYGGMGYVGRFSAGRLLEEDRQRLAGGSQGTGASSWIQDDKEFFRAVVDAIPKAQSDFGGNLLSQAGTAISTGMGSAAFIGLIDLTFAGLGSLALKRRRRLLV